METFIEFDHSHADTIAELGYPKSREMPAGWIDETAPGRRKYGGPNPKSKTVSAEESVQVVAGLEARTGSAAEVAARHGVPRMAPYVWRREMMGDNGGEPEKRGNL